MYSTLQVILDNNEMSSYRTSKNNVTSQLSNCKGKSQPQQNGDILIVCSSMAEKRRREAIFYNSQVMPWQMSNVIWSTKIFVVEHDKADNWAVQGYLSSGMYQTQRVHLKKLRRLGYVPVGLGRPWLLCIVLCGAGPMRDHPSWWVGGSDKGWCFYWKRTIFAGGQQWARSGGSVGTLLALLVCN